VLEDNQDMKDHKFDILSIKTIIVKNMIRIHPEGIQKSDEMYYLMRGIVYSLCFCVLMCVGLIVLITLAIENEMKDGSGSY